jgi:hypothetical protein
MKLRHILSVVLAVGACATTLNHANAQEKTRAQVRQELIDAENHGLRLVTDASYPDISPIYRQSATQMKDQRDSGKGPEMSGTSAEGRRKAPDMPGSKDPCVGPVSFCNIYFGS